MQRGDKVIIMGDCTMRLGTFMKAGLVRVGKKQLKVFSKCILHDTPKNRKWVLDTMFKEQAEYAEELQRELKITIRKISALLEIRAVLGN